MTTTQRTRENDFRWGYGLMISIGPYGGFYFARGWSKRLCLGWIAFTFIPVDGDIIIDMAAMWSKEHSQEAHS